MEASIFLRSGELQTVVRCHHIRPLQSFAINACHISEPTGNLDKADKPKTFRDVRRSMSLMTKPPYVRSPMVRVALILATVVLAIFQAIVTTTNATEVLSFGINGNGRTGLGTNVGTAFVATPIVTSNLVGKTIGQVSAGSAYSLLLTDDGTVFSFGANAQGRTGLGFDSPENTLVATPIITTNFAGTKIVQVDAGGNHSLILADNGTVFGFGANFEGELGLGTTNPNQAQIASPIDTTNLVGKTIVQVSAGSQHNLLLANDGAVFSFGDNEYGQTGLGSTIGHTLIATPIDIVNIAGKKITNVAAGQNHNLLLAEDGSVFGFGLNAYGQTGSNAAVGIIPTATPIDSSKLSGKTIAQIAAGARHSLLLASDGTVFSFGSNENGHTGLGIDSGNTLVPTPIDMTSLGGRIVTQIAAGEETSLLLTDNGTVFSFGRNSNGRTGLGQTIGNTLVPTPIDMANLTGRRAIAIATYQDHTLLLTVPEPSIFVLFVVSAASLFGRRQR